MSAIALNPKPPSDAVLCKWVFPLYQFPEKSFLNTRAIASTQSFPN
jgi:hypothetical protein